jgi:hypothetical protein
MRSLPTLLAITLLAAGAWTAPVAAQCPDDKRLRIQRELEATDARIDQAVTAVGDGGNEQARLELRVAQEIQARAKAEFAAQHCRMALDLTLRARLRASHAIELVRGTGTPGLPDPGRVLSQLERTRDLLERARDRIEECNDDRARAILRAAFDMQQRAEEALAQGRSLAAFQLTVSARERGLRALRLCNMEDNLRESAERALRRTDEMLARARELVANRAQERARKVLMRGLELQERANVEFRAERFEASLRLTQSARTLARRSVLLSGGTI